MTLGANTLYVTTEGAYVSVEGEMLRIRVEKETRLEVPMHHLSALVTFTPVGVSPAAMHACSERGIAVVFFGPTGRFLARVEGPTSPTATLRRRQYRIADDEAARLTFARAFVGGKIANARAQLRRAGRTRGTDEDAFDAPSAAVISTATSVTPSAFSPHRPLRIYFSRSRLTSRAFAERSSIRSSSSTRRTSFIPTCWPTCTS